MCENKWIKYFVKTPEQVLISFYEFLADHRIEMCTVTHHPIHLYNKILQSIYMSSKKNQKRLFGKIKLHKQEHTLEFYEIYDAVHFKFEIYFKGTP